MLSLEKLCLLASGNAQSLAEGQVADCGRLSEWILVDDRLFLLESQAKLEGPVPACLADWL